MLEKIGLPAKPSLRGNNWVVDATHCQGCTSQFTFINRKHHCRRCGGLFCGTCTQQRMILRGQGDSPVRICEPCKKLEEAARFELRYGQRNRGARGSSKLMSRNEDELLNQILGNDGMETSSSGSHRNTDMISGIHRVGSSTLCSSDQEGTGFDAGRELPRSHSVGKPNEVHTELGSISPGELRQRALEEKKMHRILKGEGKSEEALKAFKRGKELERQADALEMSIKKQRRKGLSSGNRAEDQGKAGNKESAERCTPLTAVGKGKNDLISELRELGWSDQDLHDADKESAKMTLEGELSSLLGGTSQSSDRHISSGGSGKTQVMEHKRKALSLKREGKLAEAKEELKKAKLLEKQLEEVELLGPDEDSDDEITTLIRSMENDKQEELLVGYKLDDDFNFDKVVGPSDNFVFDNDPEVTDDDQIDPEIAATLQSLGWVDDFDGLDSAISQSVIMDKEMLQREILSLKREAVNQKRAGNMAEAMVYLKKAKLLEKEAEDLKSQEKPISEHPSVNNKRSTSQNINTKNDVNSKLAPKSRLMIQKELLALKKKALALRREGKLEEADEELKKGKSLEQQLEEMDYASKLNAQHVTIGSPALAYEHPDVSETVSIQEGEEDVTEQDLHDPTYLSILTNLGWQDEDNQPENCAANPSEKNDNRSMRNSESFVSKASLSAPLKTPRNKAEIQRELLGLKRKALKLRREGKIDEAEEVLSMAKPLEAQMAELEGLKKEIQYEPHITEEEFISPIKSAAGEGDVEDFTEKDTQDPAMQNNLGMKNEEHEPLPPLGKVLISGSVSFMPTDQSEVPSSFSTSAGRPRSRGEIQRELLGLKRKALALRREGKTEEAEELLKNAKVLESQMEEHDGANNEILPNPHQVVNPGSTESFLIKEQEKNAVEMTGKSDLIGVAQNKRVVNSSINPSTQVGIEEDLQTSKEEPLVNLDEKLNASGANSAYTSLNNQNPLHSEVLAHKKKAVALKREGKLAEARNELKQAKLIEKRMEEQIPQSESGKHDMSSSISSAPLKQKEPGISDLAPKSLSGRSRFKLQQEALSHKRQAMKLRKEGQMDKAEAEFQLAKALESQLEEFTSQDSSNSSVHMAVPIDKLGVEDFLDPQLLSALKAVGVVDTTAPSQGLDRSRPAPKAIGVEDANVASQGPGKVSPLNSENPNQERIQLEEQIKAEKVKAVNLKRSGKQAEALDALRRSKLLEKKLNSLSAK
ncbi:hypothetical protein K2173_004547 [Erythroxylum novogranatense]|uniref:FYVE-type domain-containing protein n=1 Tax=Erythroxylum novogranatense TaxID=1862640 RepID=A0AAV8T6B2_9ROSI|nr:hypothetical protein K2173_004547 [Erythroxylum novogranatense]